MVFELFQAGSSGQLNDPLKNIFIPGMMMLLCVKSIYKSNFIAEVHSFPLYWSGEFP